VGPRRPDELPRHQMRHQGDEPMGGDDDRVLLNVQENMPNLMQRIPMVQMEDLSEVMQR
jgi:hypothetical protein